MACITKDDYLKSKGVNLDIELQGGDNPSEKVTRFIDEVESWCLDYLASEYAMNDALTEMYPNQLYRFKRGLIEQIQYTLNNGWLAKDSGFNVDNGLIVDLSKIFIAPDALRQFRLGGMCNIGTERC